MGPIFSECLLEIPYEYQHLHLNHTASHPIEQLHLATIVEKGTITKTPVYTRGFHQAAPLQC